MIVDSSALVAILRAEPDAARYAEALAAADRVLLSAANFLETAVVVDSARSRVASRQLDEMLSVADIQVVAVTPAQAVIARKAYRDFGKGSGHPAGLNFGDCFAYALAIDSQDELLFKGDDFAHTDVLPAR